MRADVSRWWWACVVAVAGAGCSGGDDRACSETPVCSDDGYRVVRACRGGEAEVVTDCLAEQGRLCEAGACVDPWRWGGPTFSQCAGVPGATVESLAEKAAHYDELARRLHVHPKLKQAMTVVLKADPGDPTRPAVPIEQATWQDVEGWVDDNHNGIWSGFYLAAQAYRYAVTREPAVLETIRLLVDGDRERTEVTGQRGHYSRGVRFADVAGHSCPTDDESYTTSQRKDRTKMVRIRDDGCAWVISHETMQWTNTGNCGHEWLAGGCFVDDVSKDVTLGHVFALATVARLVDDETLRAAASERVRAVGERLVENHLAIVDWDGRVTGAGRVYALALDDYPGFNAAMALSYVATAADVGGSAELRDFYERCLLQLDGEVACIQQATEQPKPYTDWLGEAHLFQEACRDNFCSHSMQNLNLWSIVAAERDPDVRERIQRSLDEDSMRAAGERRAGLRQKNAWFDLLWATHKLHGPRSDGPAFEAVEESICLLRQFPATYESRAIDPRSRYVESCETRGGGPSGEVPLEIADRCPDYFVWWHTDPYELTGCLESPRTYFPPQGFLLPYWMGRYHGFIEEGS